MSQNNTLYKACKAWLREALAFLQSKSASSDDSENVSQGNDWLQAALKDNYFGKYLTSRNEIMNLPAFMTILVGSPFRF